MFLLEFEGVEQPHAEMHRMKEVRNLVPLSSVPFDVRKSTVSLFMAEVLYRLIREVEANEPLFDFLCSAVQQLDRMEQGVANFHLWFLVRLSAYLGFYPGNEYRDGGWFDIRSGLFCDAMPQHRTCMGPASARLLGGLMEREAAELDSLRLGRGERLEFMEAMLIFFGYHFDAIHSVQSLRILREVFC
ncbi:MAG: DNA repair protein RecO [Alistipes indistinctus]